MNKLDDMDKKIINELQKDSRKPFVEIAKEVGVSDPTIHARVKKLQDNGVIKQFTTVLSPGKVEKGVAAFIEINMKPNNVEEVIKRLENIDDMLEIHETHGDYDILVKLRAKSNDELRDVVVRKIHSIPNINNIKVTTILKTRKEKQLKIP
jgi:Lrp/AsnC family transcriptional regulator for asnA, asnC and gidA